PARGAGRVHVRTAPPAGTPLTVADDPVRSAASAGGRAGRGRPGGPRLTESAGDGSSDRGVALGQHRRRRRGGRRVRREAARLLGWLLLDLHTRQGVYLGR